MNPSRILFVSSVLALSLIAIILLYRFGNERIIEENKLAMGTLVQIKVRVDNSVDEIKARQAIDAAFKEIARVEKLFSLFRKDSEASRINSLKKGERAKINSEVFDVIEKSVGFNRMTGGAFDITVRPLVRLWDKAKTKGTVPSEEEIKAALRLVGTKNISLRKSDKSIMLAQDGVELDFGGIAKGYATDRAAKIMRTKGIKNAIVNSGGNIYCIGARSRGVPWKVGIRHPRKSENVLFELDVADKAVVTSGDYEQYFSIDKKRYSHIINPITGYAIGDTAISATVLADDSMTADALATALCVLGRSGIDIVDSMDAVDAILIYKEDGQLRIEMTSQARTRYHVNEKNP